ncbi:MAG: hypothetical protein ACOC42_01015 [Halobacteriota archaeon]
MTPRSRRDVLRSAGPVATGLIAGCVGLRGPTPDEFAYPPGFTVDGIDASTALGPDSPMASVESVRLETEWGIAATDWSTENAVMGRFDQAHPSFERERRSLNTLEQRLHILGEYFDSTEVISRERVEPRSVQYRYSAREHDWDPLEELSLDELQRLVSDVDLTVERVATVDDHLVASYRARTEDFGEGAPLRDLGDTIGELTTADLELGLLESGHLTTVRFIGSMTSSSGGIVELEASWRYDDVDETVVTPPEWLDDVPALDRPEVVVEFDECTGEAVVVDITTIRHTDQVAVVIDEEGVYEAITSPQTIEVPASAYHDDDGSPRSIFVFAENELRGPVVIDIYRPGGP